MWNISCDRESMCVLMYVCYVSVMERDLLSGFCKMSWVSKGKPQGVQPVSARCISQEWFKNWCVALMLLQACSPVLGSSLCTPKAGVGARSAWISLGTRWQLKTFCPRLGADYQRPSGISHATCCTKKTVKMKKKLLIKILVVKVRNVLLFFF